MGNCSDWERKIMLYFEVKARIGVVRKEWDGEMVMGYAQKELVGRHLKPIPRKEGTRKKKLEWKKTKET